VFKPLRVYLFLVLLGQSGVLSADVIYKSVGKDGVVTYSDTPISGSVKTETIEVDTLSPEERRAALMMRANQKHLDQETLERMRAKEEEWRKIDQEILRAQADLKDAEEALENGRAPLPGETKGTAGGFSRLSESYFQRLESMEQAVKDARDRLNEAYQAREQLR